MTNTITAASYTNFAYPAPGATAGANNNVQAFAAGAANTTPPSASLLAPVSLSNLPAIQMPSAQFAAMQAGAGFRAPDPEKTEAQQNAKAYALVKDAKTGQVLGGVWPGAAVVSAPDIGVDQRIVGNSNWSDVTQYLAQDIAKTTGNPVTVEYFQPGDPNAPTFGNRSAIM